MSKLFPFLPLFFSTLFLSLPSLHSQEICDLDDTDQNTNCFSIEEIQVKMMPPWVRFTHFEQQMVSKIVGVSHGETSFQDFYRHYEDELQNKIVQIIATFNPIFQQALCNSPRDLALKRKGVQLLEEALKRDAAYAIDMTIELLESDGIVNRKTKIAFNRWQKGTVRLFYALMKLQPSLDREKIGDLLERRFLELNYFIQSLVLYKVHPTAKNANTLNIHNKIPQDYALDMTLFLERPKNN